jgi:hypothetical protein
MLSLSNHEPPTTQERVVFALAAILALTLLLGGQPPHTQAQASTPAPQVKIFVPWLPNGALNPALTVSAQVTVPECQVGSILTTRPDAWRCGTADPCFAPFPFVPSSDENTLVCAGSGPWSGQVVMLTVQTPLTSVDDCRASGDCRRPIDLTGTPWAIELGNGVRCVKGGGTAAIVAGLGPPYGCAQVDGTPAGIAAPDPTDPNSVLYLTPGDDAIVQVPVDVDWY